MASNSRAFLRSDLYFPNAAFLCLRSNRIINIVEYRACTTGRNYKLHHVDENRMRCAWRLGCSLVHSNDEENRVLALHRRLFMRAICDSRTRGGCVHGLVHDRGESVPLGERGDHRMAANDARNGQRWRTLRLLEVRGVITHYYNYM